MPSNSFLEKLLQKLKGNDGKSIHLNCLPSNFNRIDLYDFVNVQHSLQLQFLHLLLQKSEFKFSLTIDWDAVSATTEEEEQVVKRLIKKLNGLYYQDYECEQELGYKTFGFGYPLLIIKDPQNKDKILKAPLFIWYLDLQKSKQKINTWTISRNEDFPVVVNPALTNFLQATYKISIHDLEQFIVNELLVEKDILQAVTVVLQKLAVHQPLDSFVATVLPCTNKETIEQLTKEHAWIRFSGVFGLYKNTKQSIIKDVESLIQSNNLEAILQLNNATPNKEIISPIALDATQEQLLFSLNTHQKIIIQGPPGTGKSQTLTAIICKAILNNKKVLVVCEKKTALEVLQDNLQHLGITNATALIEDVYTDRKKIVERVRQFLEEIDSPISKFRQYDFDMLKEEFYKERTHLNQLIKLPNIDIFGDDTYTDLIIKQENRINTITDIASFNTFLQRIANSLFQFSFEEYQHLKNTLESAVKIRVQCTERSFNLAVLSDQFILKEESGTILNILEKLEKLSNKLYLSIQTHQQNAAYNELTGFKHFWHKLSALFNKKTKTLLIQQQNDLQLIKEINELLHLHQPLAETIIFYLPRSILSELNPLITQLTRITTQYKESYIEVEPYRNWINLLSSLSQKEIQLIEQLKTIKTENWNAYFEAWYLEQILLAYSLKNQFNDLNIAKISAIDEQLQTSIVAKINHSIDTKRQSAIATKDISTLKYLYNLRKNKQYETKNTLRKIISDDIDFFTAFFPIVLTNAEVCCTLFEAVPYFDIIILDEASQLKIEETYTCLLRAKQHVISGDRHQMPPSNHFANLPVFYSENEEQQEEDFLADSQSLLEYADDSAYKNFYIDFHYRSKHPDLINFSNHAFYQSRLIPMPAKQHYNAIEYYQINGRYNDGINKDEAEAIVHYLFSIPSTQAIPSIGIGTFNIHQRDYILDLIFAKALEDKAYGTLLEQFLQKGLFVKNLENIQGDERDIMLLSTTFGLNEEGKFRQQFGPISQEKGYKLLNVLITRAKEKICIFSSIPSTTIQQYNTDITIQGNTGRTIFYAYLAYAKAIAQSNISQASTILNLIRDKDINARPSKTTSTFKEYVYSYLIPKYGEHVFMDYKIGGLQLDFVWKRNDQIILHLLLIDAIECQHEAAYRQALHYNKLLQPLAVKTIVCNSYQWHYDRNTILNQIDAYINAVSLTTIPSSSI